MFSNGIVSTDTITEKVAADISRDITSQINSFMVVPKHINEVYEARGKLLGVWAYIGFCLILTIVHYIWQFKWIKDYG